MFSILLLVLHDDLDEGSQQWCETVLALNRLREIVQHSYNCSDQVSRSLFSCLLSTKQDKLAFKLTTTRDYM